MTFLLGEIGRRNKVCSSTFSGPLGVVPGALNERPGLRSLSAVTVELVSPLGSGVSIRMPVCSYQPHFTVSVLSVVKVRVGFIS